MPGGAGGGAKKKLKSDGHQRLWWRVLREFKALPTEERVRQMKERDLLWCALNLMLDDEEALEALCPACRAQAEGGACPVCGGQTVAGQRELNAAFDLERFERMKGGETP